MNFNFKVSLSLDCEGTWTVCAGAGGLDPGVVAGAILRGIKTATSSTPFYSLTNIRLVLIKINVFLEFKKEAMQTFVALTNTSSGDFLFHFFSSPFVLDGQHLFSYTFLIFSFLDWTL